MLCALGAGGAGLSPAWGTKILHAAQNSKNKNKKHKILKINTKR